jgi:hypothetical protein
MRSYKAAVAVLATAALLSAAMPDDKHLGDWVEKRVRGLQPSRAERRIDEIGWAHRILPAEGLARSLNRPVFLFTHDGRIETGRC